MPTLPPPDPEHRDNHFNFLRLALATMVLLAHAPELVDGDRRREPLTRLFGSISLGEAAVAGFFLLSGFLIVQSWQRRPAPGAFLAARALRIYPGFVVAALAGVFVAGTLGAAHPAEYLRAIQPGALAWDVAQLHPPDTPGTFAGSFYPVVNGNLWTVSYEFACYLCAALLGVCGLVRRRRGFLVFTLIVGGVWLLPLAGRPLAVFSTAFLGRAGAQGVHLALLLCRENGLFTHLLCFFCVGGCFALYRDRVRFSGRWALAGSLVVLGCLFSPTAAPIALATAGAYAFFTLAFAPVPLLARFRGKTDVSYGVYLYGWPVGKLLLWYLPGLSPWTLFALSAVGSAAAGWASWRLVERPFLRLKRRLAAEGLPPPFPLESRPAFCQPPRIQPPPGGGCAHEFQ